MQVTELQQQAHTDTEIDICRTHFIWKSRIIVPDKNKKKNPSKIICTEIWCCRVCQVDTKVWADHTACILKAVNPSLICHISTLKTEVTVSSDALVHIYQTTRHHIPEENNFQLFLVFKKTVLKISNFTLSSRKRLRAMCRLSYNGDFHKNKDMNI